MAARQRAGLPDALRPSVARSWTRSRALTPTFAGVSLRASSTELGSHAVAVQRRRRPKARRSCTSTASCAARASFILTEYVPTDEQHRAALPAAADHRPHPSQYNVGAQTRRTANVVWHPGGRARDPPARRRGARHARRRLGELASRAGETTLARHDHRARAPGVVYTTFHHPDTQANVVTTDISDWATNCPEYKVTAVQVSPSNGPSDWQESIAS